MILYPAIDLKDGACVRLLRGDMDQVTVFNDDPGAQARAFAEAGFSWIHVVDLNGAVSGRPVNSDAVAAIVDAVDIDVQLGGGIRDLDTVEHWLDAGLRRVILGTVAVSDPDMVVEACKRFPGRIVVGIDARNGMVAVDGWTRTSEATAGQVATRFADCGVAAIIYTDIDRDGAMGGPNVAATAALARAVDIPVIASGGVSSHEDLQRLKEEEDSGIAGVICGRALYDGRIDPARALEILGAGPAGRLEGGRC